MDAEVGVVVQQLDEPLTDGACSISTVCYLADEQRP